jgi:hypothetical protein
MAKLEQVRKITLGTCGAQPNMELLAKLEKSGGSAPLLDVYGIASKFKPGQSDKGPFIRFFGSFRAIRHGDKAAFSSTQFIAPKMVEESLWSVMGSGGPDGELSNVQFAFRIGCKFDKKAATKYVYSAESLMPVAENDPLVMLQQQLSGKLLAAPKE